MAKNEVYRDADRISLPVGAAVKAGDPISVGDLVGWAQTDAAGQAASLGLSNIKTSNATGWASCVLVGAFKYPVTVSGATTIGTKVYYNAGALTTTAAGGKPFGFLLSAATGAGTALQIVRVQNGL